MNPPGLFGLIDRHQAAVLADRYLEVFFGDPKGIAFLVLQPLAVAGCAGLAWQGARPTPTLYFVLVFSAIFFGCVNACREIVKERAIFARERLVGLTIPAYVASKAWILGGLGLGQALLFYVGIRYFLVLDGSPALTLVVLYAGLLAGTALGLLISAAVGSDVAALTLVPVVMIPQLLFSKLIMPNVAHDGLVAAFERATLARWSYQAMETVVSGAFAWADFARGLGTLLAMALALLVAAGLVLRMKELGDG